MATTTETRGLEVRGIQKSFSGVRVLRGVSVVVRPGEVVGLVGHNGAGKSTLLRTISGALRPDAGEIHIDGELQHFGNPADARDAGIGTVYQELSLLPNLTVAQNAFLGSEKSRGGLLDRAPMREATVELTRAFGLAVDPDRKVGQYPVATRQLLEVAIVTSHQARYLLLDEPTTSLEGRQVDRFLDQVRGMADRGLGVILVDHKLDELYAVADRVVALVDGQLRIDAQVSEVPRSEVVKAIAGADLETARAESEAGSVPHSAEAEPRVKVRGLTGPVLDGLDLEARPGRVLGLYGLVGSGRTEFLRTLVGLDRLTGGTIEIDGKPYRPRDPGRARQAGLVYVTEERKQDGIVADLSCSVNLMLPVLTEHRRLGFLQWRGINQMAAERMDELDVLGDRSGPIVRLSGGNQQKIVLGRGLVQRPSIFLLDEPTKGVDLGVKAQIHRMITRLAHEDGLTVIVVSSEEDEICEVSDDIVVFSHGAATGAMLAAAEVTPAQLREAAWEAA
ncbi:MAG: sugar ABC transporter ATP-binding protein [Propioniciclava sp.]